MTRELAPIVVLVAAVLAIGLLFLGIRQVRREAIASPHVPLLAIGTTVVATIGYILVTGAPLNPVVAIVTVLVGVVAGGFAGRAVQVYRRESVLVRRGGSSFLVVWGAGYLVALAFGQSGYAASHGIGILAMMFGAAWTVGMQVVVLGRINAIGRAAPAYAPAYPPAYPPALTPTSGFAPAAVPVSSLPPAPAALPSLLLVRGWANVTSFDIRGAVTIGTDPSNTITVSADGYACPRHAWIEPRDGGWDVVDGGTSTGTWVNGYRIVRHSLRSGDDIQVGMTVFRFAAA